MIIYFVNKITMYCFIRLWISQRSKIKLYRLCMTNLIIEKRIQYLSKYYNIINEKRYIRMSRDTYLHIISINYEWINNKIRNYILSECQSYKKRLLLILFIYYWIRKKNSLSSHMIICQINQKQRSYHLFIQNMLHDFCIRN